MTTHVFYYIWLEKNGAPFAPPHVLDVFLHTGNSETARFTPSTNSDGMRVSMIDGIVRGIICTGNRGHSVISASIDGVGTTHVDFFVGPV